MKQINLKKPCGVGYVSPEVLVVYVKVERPVCASTEKYTIDADEDW